MILTLVEGGVANSKHSGLVMTTLLFSKTICLYLRLCESFTPALTFLEVVWRALLGGRRTQSNATFSNAVFISVQMRAAIEDLEPFCRLTGSRYDLQDIHRRHIFVLVVN